LKAPEAPFEEPWQAQLFRADRGAERGGQFTWTEWAESSARACKGVGAEHYWEVWSEALVALLERKGIAAASEVFALTERWQAAAKATPHGKPILLSAAD
jgi:hypothetical protein